MYELFTSYLMYIMSCRYKMEGKKYCYKINIIYYYIISS